MAYLETATETEELATERENWAGFYASLVTTLSLENLV